MTHGREDMTNQGLSADARTFFLQLQIDDPTDGQVIVPCDNAPFPFTVEKIHYRIDAGDCEIIPEIDGVPIDTTESDSSGVILVDQPAGKDAFTDTSLDVVGESAILSLTIQNTESSATVLRVQFVCRRTLENLAVSDDV